MPGLIRSASLTYYADVARRAGLDPGRMLREFGLPPRCLVDLEIKIPMDPVRRLLEVSAERSGVEAFGLLMAEARRLSNLGPLGLLVREQPTLRLAVEAFGLYGRRQNEALLFAIEEAGDVVVLREEIIVGNTGSVRQSTELAIGVAYRMLCTLLGPDWRARRVCFAHDAPADRSVHERVFGRNVEFGHDFNGIVCTRADLDRPNPNADPAMAKYAQQLLEASLAGSADAISGEVRGLVVMLLGQGSVYHRTRGAAHGRRPSDHSPISRPRAADVFGHRRNRSARTRRTLPEGSRSFADGRVVAAGFRGTKRFFALVSAAVQRPGIGRACARAKATALDASVLPVSLAAETAIPTPVPKNDARR